MGGIETNYSFAGEGGDDWSAGTILGLRARGFGFLGRRREDGGGGGRGEGRKRGGRGEGGLY